MLAIPPTAAARVLELPGASELLDGYRAVPQVLAAFALEEPACALRWNALGILAPARERLPFIGCLIPSNLFPGRAPRGRAAAVRVHRDARCTAPRTPRSRSRSRPR